MTDRNSRLKKLHDALCILFIVSGIFTIFPATYLLCLGVFVAIYFIFKDSEFATSTYNDLVTGVPETLTQYDGYLPFRLASLLYFYLKRIGLGKGFSLLGSLFLTLVHCPLLLSQMWLLIFAAIWSVMLVYVPLFLVITTYINFVLIGVVALIGLALFVVRFIIDEWRERDWYFCLIFVAILFFLTIFYLPESLIPIILAHISPILWLVLYIVSLVVVFVCFVSALLLTRFCLLRFMKYLMRNVFEENEAQRDYKCRDKALSSLVVENNPKKGPPLLRLAIDDIDDIDEKVGGDEYVIGMGAKYGSKKNLFPMVSKVSQESEIEIKIKSARLVLNVGDNKLVAQTLSVPLSKQGQQHTDNTNTLDLERKFDEGTKLKLDEIEEGIVSLDILSAEVKRFKEWGAPLDLYLGLQVLVHFFIGQYRNYRASYRAYCDVVKKEFHIEQVTLMIFSYIHPGQPALELDADADIPAGIISSTQLKAHFSGTVLNNYKAEEKKWVTQTKKENKEDQEPGHRGTIYLPDLSRILLIDNV